MKKITLSLALIGCLALSAQAANFELEKVCDGAGNLSGSVDEVAKTFPIADCNAVGKSRGGNVDDIDAIQDGSGVILLKQSSTTAPDSSLSHLRSEGFVDLIQEHGAKAKENNKDVLEYVQDDLSASIDDSVKKAGFEKAGPPVINIDGTDYEFPADYTEPSENPMNTCSHGFENKYNIGFNCFAKGLVTLGVGYLNIVELTTTTWMNSNNLINLDNLNNLVKANGLRFNQNNLQNVNGLSNLTTIAGVLNLGQNNLTSISGLSNLKTVTDTLLLFQNANLLDISPLSSLDSSSFNSTGDSKMILDDRNYTGKMSASSYMCNGGFSRIQFGTEASSSFIGEANRSKVCEL